MFSRIAARPQLLLARALYDAQRIVSGPAIQSRCLECPPAVRPLAARERATLGAWLKSALW